MASAGQVTVEFAAETSDFTADLKKVQSQLGKMEKDFISLGSVARKTFSLFTAGAILSFVKSAVQAADALGDAAERSGIAVESFSRLQFAASRADVEVAAFTTGITKFQVAISKASEGNKEALGTFSLLNIEISKLQGLSIEQQLGVVADAFRNIQDPADRTRISIELFGRAAGPQFTSFLNEGSEGIKKFTELADQLGITMSESAAKGIDRGTKAIEGFFAAVKQGIAVRFGDLVTGIFGSGDEVVDLEFKLKNLQALLKGLQLAPAPDTERIRSVTEEIRQLTDQLSTLKRTTVELNLLPLPWLDKLQLIDLTAIEALKIHVDDLDAAFKKLNQTILEIQQARVNEALEIAGDAAAESQRKVEQSITADFQAELDKRFAASEAHRALELSQEQALQEAMQNLQAGTLNAAISALQSFAGTSRKAAIALVLINKARAIAEAIQNTAVAVTKALTIDPTGALAARAQAIGAVQIALIAASGFGEIQQINRSGGAPIGSPANPINAQSLDDSQRGATPQSTVQVIVQGNVVGNQEFIDDLIADISDAVSDKDVILIKPSSRNALELANA